ncbi:MAG TPA: bifunctional precorrin-2 dehydrogenase/sirohydrochlorin ferrochelatase [Herpetosiphonaceae bacterium]|nr:bifunctional precorrin-2 dehydrogenase/sirohydrochlorin ferrochelatase [Herpetosiphonaceae bacterium]
MGSSSYPVVLTGLHDVRCVVVGGGPVAERKVEALLEGGAFPTLISPTLTDGLRSLAQGGRLEYIARVFHSGDLHGAVLAIAATGDRGVNAEVAREARHSGILVNVVDDPDAGNFTTMGSVRRGDLLLAVSTGGTSPALAALIRRKLATTFGPEYGELLALLGALRRGTAQQLPAEARGRLWRRLASEKVLRWLRNGRKRSVEAYVQELVEQARGTLSGRNNSGVRNA